MQDYCVFEFIGSRYSFVLCCFDYFDFGFGLVLFQCLGNVKIDIVVIGDNNFFGFRFFVVENVQCFVDLIVFGDYISQVVCQD